MQRKKERKTKFETGNNIYVHPGSSFSTQLLSLQEEQVAEL